MDDKGQFSNSTSQVGSGLSSCSMGWEVPIIKYKSSTLVFFRHPVIDLQEAGSILFARDDLLYIDRSNCCKFQNMLCLCDNSNDVRTVFANSVTLDHQ